MIPNCGVVKIEFFSKEDKSFVVIHTTTKTWKSVQTYLKKSSDKKLNAKYVSTRADIMGKIIITFNKFETKDINMLRHIYWGKMEHLDPKSVAEYFCENTPTSNANIAKTQQALQQQVPNYSCGSN